MLTARDVASTRVLTPVCNPLTPMCSARAAFLARFGSEHFINLAGLLGAVHGAPKHCTNSLTLLLHFNLACPCH